MKRLLLWTLALVIAAAPAVAEVCRLDCARPDPPACPLHQKAPLVAAIVVAFADFSRPQASASLLPIEEHHTPPPRAPRTDILRI
jgi:hypothetical protein